MIFSYPLWPFAANEILLQPEIKECQQHHTVIDFFFLD
jgi:hypothetical protein